MYHLEKLDHLKIPLEHIISATDNFSPDNFLGRGGFGSVFKGQLPFAHHSSEQGTAVAVKRLDVKGGQGDHEFLTEIVMLASYKHENLVSLVGFVEEGSEKILVYKIEDNGSLEKHLDSPDLTWEQRLRICLGAARGLKYLHDDVGTRHRVLHRDVKSSNILLDGNWKAKISDFGLSKLGPRNHLYTFLVTRACGTLGYIDPQYATTGLFTKESDVFSFGVVLFEILCGRFAVIDETYDDENYKHESRLLSTLVKRHYGKGKLEELIFPNLFEQMKPESLEVFSKIAFRCLNADRKGRPTMRTVVEELKSAIEHQHGKQLVEPERQTGPRTTLWGSKTMGKPFLFQLENNQKLRKITVSHEIWIYSLTFTVEDSNGVSHSQRYGGGRNTYDRRGIEDCEINLDADEEIIGLSGSIGIYEGYELVTSLSFMTNKRKYGPFSQEADHCFSGSWDLGLFDGFYGRYGLYIDAVGCCLKPTALLVD